MTPSSWSLPRLHLYPGTSRPQWLPPSPFLLPLCSLRPFISLFCITWAASWTPYLQSHFFQPNTTTKSSPVPAWQLQDKAHPPGCTLPANIWPVPTFLAAGQHTFPRSSHAKPQPLLPSPSIPRLCGFFFLEHLPYAPPHLPDACFSSKTIIVIDTFTEPNSQRDSKHAL